MPASGGDRWNKLMGTKVFQVEYKGQRGFGHLRSFCSLEAREGLNISLLTRHPGTASGYTWQALAALSSPERGPAMILYVAQHLQVPR